MRFGTNSPGSNPVPVWEDANKYADKTTQCPPLYPKQALEDGGQHGEQRGENFQLRAPVDCRPPPGARPLSLAFRLPTASTTSAQRPEGVAGCCVFGVALSPSP